MTTFRRYKVGTLMELQRRTVVVNPSSVYREIGIRSFGRGVFHKDPVLGSELGAKRVFAINPGDLVVSNVFAWEGAVALATHDEAGLIGSHRFMTWKPISDEVNVRYLLHFFGSEEGLTLLRRASPGSAGRNRTLGVKAFADLEVPLPSLDIQTRVANRLDDTVDVGDRIVDQVATMQAATTALNLDLFRGFEESTELGELLTETKRFEPVVQDATYSMAGVRWYAEGVFSREPRLGSEVKAVSLNRLVPGEFIYNRLFAWKGSFAITTNETLFASNEFPTFRIDESTILPEFLLGWFAKHQVWDVISQLSTGATPTSRNRLKQRELLGIRVPVPTLSEQQRVVRAIRILRAASSVNQRRRLIALSLAQSARNSEFARSNDDKERV